MSDRTEQARAEAERRWPGKMALAPVMKARFIDGVEWADANPQPHTITREALLSDEAVERAARALYAEDVNESIDTPWPDYDSPKNVGRPLYEERARNALLAAIEGDE